MITKRLIVVLALIAVMVVVSGCKTLSAPFGGITPNYTNLSADDLKKVAAEIEKSVKEGNREPGIKNTGSIILDTPEIQQAISTRAARAELVSKLLSSGFASEQRGGTITLLRNANYKKSTTGQQRDVNALVVMSENANRWTIYEGLLKASNLSRKNLSAIQAVFHQARVDVLESGQKYEDESGKLVTKP